jgi:hypothetical protein
MKIIETKRRERAVAMPRRQTSYELAMFQTHTAIMNSADLFDTRYGEQHRSTDRCWKFESTYNAVMPRWDI